MFSQRMVENFFKRTKFRRSRRARSSFRTSLIKKSGGSSPGPPGAQGSGRSPVASKRLAVDRRVAVKVEAVDVDDEAALAHGNGAQQCASSSSPSDHHSDTTNSAAAGGCSPTDMSAPVEDEKDSTVGDVSSSSTSKQKLKQSSSNGGEHAARRLPSAVGRPISSAGSMPVLPRSDDAAGRVMVDSLRTEVDSLKKELAKKQEAITKMQDREKQLRERLSEQAQRQLERGASKFEDISLGENRPTQLVKRYGNLYSEARLDAMDALDELPDMADADDLKVKLLLSIVVLAFRSAQRTLLETKTKIRELLHIPEVLHGNSTALCHLVQEVEDTIAIYLRKTVEKHDVSKNYEEVCDRVWETLYDYPTLRTCTGLLRYVDECVRLAWALTLQNPPLVVDYESKRFDSNMHVRFHTSDPDSVDIKCVLWPMLTEGDGGACVYRGVVVT